MLRSSNFIRIQRENPFYLRTSDFKDAENPFVYCDDKKNRKLHRQRCIDHGQRTYSLYPMRIISTMHICIPYIDYTDRSVAYHLNSFGYCINAACRVPFGHPIGVQRTLISHIWNKYVYTFRGMPLRKSTLLGSKCFTLAFCYFWFSVHIDVVRSIVRIFFFLLIPNGQIQYTLYAQWSTVVSRLFPFLSYGFRVLICCFFYLLLTWFTAALFCLGYFASD